MKSTVKPKDLKAAREALKMTQIELARELGTTQPRISYWENGMPPRSAWSSLIKSYFATRKVKI